MKRYTFTGVRGGSTTVIAEDEKTARDLAMTERWGPPDGKVILIGRPQAGNGLTLQSVEDVRKNR